MPTPKRIFTLICAAVIVLGCESEGTSQSSESPAIYTAKGFVQKGPYLLGSQMDIQELDASLNPTGKSYNTQTIDDLGSFELASELSSPYVEIKATGFYFNEISGETSQANLITNVITDLSIAKGVNVNLLTTIARPRIKFLMKNGQSFKAAKNAAETEVLAAFYIFDKDLLGFEKMDISKAGASNGVLLAVSAILQADNSVGDLSSLVSVIATDIEQDGTLDGELARTELAKNGEYVASLLGDIRTNLEDHYASKGLNVAIPDFEQFCNDDGDLLINKYDFSLSFPAVTRALLSTVYTSDPTTVKLPPGTAQATVSITEGAGQLIKNGVAAGSTVTVEDGATLQLTLTSSDEYDSDTTVWATATYQGTVNGDTHSFEVTGSFTVHTMLIQEHCDNDTNANCADCLTCADGGPCSPEYADFTASAPAVSMDQCILSAKTDLNLVTCKQAYGDGYGILKSLQTCRYTVACTELCTAEYKSISARLADYDRLDAAVDVINSTLVPCIPEATSENDISCVSWAGGGGPCTDERSACANSAACATLEQCVNESWNEANWMEIQDSCFEAAGTDVEVQYWAYQQCIFCDACDVSCVKEASTKRCEEYTGK